MHRVSTRLFACAGIAALVAAPVGRTGAQVAGHPSSFTVVPPTPPSSSNKASASISAEGTPCAGVSAIGSYTSDEHVICKTTAPVPVTPTGTYTAAATADVLAGVYVRATTLFDGSPGNVPTHLSSSAIYYRYISFGPGVASLVFSSSITHFSGVSDPSANTSFGANIDVGLLDMDNAFIDPFDTFSYASGSSFGGTVNVADLGGASSFYYDVAASSDINIGAADPFAFDDTFILDPSILCFDDLGHPTDCHLSFTPPTIPVTGTPEPASLALMGTGLVGLAGFARRKRAANAA